MSTPHRTLVSCLAAAVLLVSCTGSSGGLLGGPYSEPTLVQFSYDAITPQTVRIAPDGNVRWENNADDARGFVILPESMTPSFHCSDLRPYFVKMDTVYRSLPLLGVESERVQLPCALAPGSYDYEIWMFGAGFGKEFNDGRPQQILRGKIVVE